MVWDCLRNFPSNAKSCCFATGGCLKATGREGKEGAISCWNTKTEYFTREAKPYIGTLRCYDRTYRLTTIAFVIAEIAGFVLMCFAFKHNPPVHPFVGVPICVGALFVFPVILSIISCSRNRFCKSVRINPDETHDYPSSDSGSESDKSETQD